MAPFQYSGNQNAERYRNSPHSSSTPRDTTEDTLRSTFIYPDLPDVSITDEIIRHADLFPTILSMLNESIPDTIDGNNILKQGYPDTGYSYAMANKQLMGKEQFYSASGICGPEGGYVRNHTPISKRAIFSSGPLTGSNWKAQHLRKSNAGYWDALSTYLCPEHTYGSPPVDTPTDLQIIETHRSSDEVQPQSRDRLSTLTEEQLREFGYL